MKAVNKKLISVIIVNYKSHSYLFKCLESLYTNSKEETLEVIVVDNDDKKTISAILKRRFPKVIYIPNKNLGFAQGNNRGAEKANGEYLFFLNPDTLVYKDSIKNLVAYLQKNKKVGVVAPVLYGPDGNSYPLQGFGELTPLRAVFGMSVINKLWPGNPISKSYWMNNARHKEVREVDVVPGSAFMISRCLFQEIGAFDEKFFLYFEENDLCKRVRDAGAKIIMLPSSRVFHAWGASTSLSDKDTSVIFDQSRFYYFKKHFGLLKALIVSFVLSINLSKLLIFIIIILGFFLRTDRISKLMLFIGDQAWFYLSARDMIVNFQIPLVGIASSHPWLHQGAFWTYLLAGALYVGNFNPVSGALLSAIIDSAAIFLFYKLGSNFFSNKIGLLSSLLYAVSPVMVGYARMPYHTSPIPLLTLAFVFCVLTWIIKKNPWYFPLTLMFLTILYNFEIATSVFVLPLLIFLFYGFFKKEKYFTLLLNKKIFLLSILLFLLPLVPFLIYDTGHGFPQTAKYVAWVGYKILQFLRIFPKSRLDSGSYLGALIFLIKKYSLLIYPNFIVSIILLAGSFIYNAIYVFEKKVISPTLIVLICSSASFVGYLVAKTASDAYLPMIFPLLILLFVLIFRREAKIGVIIVILISMFNLVQLEKSFMVTDGYSISGRIEVAKKIENLALGKKYNLEFRGPGQQFKSSTMTYEYLMWWLYKNPPAKVSQTNKIVVTEGKPSISVETANNVKIKQ